MTKFTGEISVYCIYIGSYFIFLSFIRNNKNFVLHPIYNLYLFKSFFNLNIC